MSEPASQPELTPSFLTILYTMATQAMIALGEIPNPLTQQTAVDEKQARWHVGSLEILLVKTEGNLADDESAALKKVLSEIRAKFTEKLGD